MQLNPEKYTFNIKSQRGKRLVFDPVRKKFVAFTPEEFVRQTVIQYLITEKQFPLKLLAIEPKLRYHKLPKRADIVAYNNQGKPVLIVECKQPSVPISEKVFEQIVMYNAELSVPYLLVSNGQQNFCAQMDYEKRSYEFVEDVPEYGEM